ncbi:hypothetical protein COT07_04470 [Candidatus Woesearchaeota archaeon CG07_land_8_20_14_0_80_44_23]|nr:MAG: hypothetical protein COT07_04470 [Candidatus Woesearchaeota archaeon CG07_land_8_20_14_0_80_44_23]
MSIAKKLGRIAASEELLGILSGVKITDYALTKANMYAGVVCELSSLEIECGGFLAAERGSDVADDAYLFTDQEVCHDGYVGKPGMLSSVIEEIAASGKRVIGWWHSHDSMPAFHSQRDEQNFRQLFLSVAPYNQVVLSERRIPIKESAIERIVRGGKEKIRISGSSIIEIQAPENSNLLPNLLPNLQPNLPPNLLQEAYEIERISSGFAYSVVVSLGSGKPYAELMFEDPATQRLMKIENAPLEIIISGKQVEGLYDILKEEACSKVRIDGVPISELIREREEKRKREKERKRKNTDKGEYNKEETGNEKSAPLSEPMYEPYEPAHVPAPAPAPAPANPAANPAVVRQQESQLEPGYCFSHAHPVNINAIPPIIQPAIQPEIQAEIHSNYNPAVHLKYKNMREMYQDSGQQNYSATDSATLKSIEMMLRYHEGSLPDLQEVGKEIDRLEYIAKSCSDEALSERARNLEAEIKSRGKREIEQIDNRIREERSKEIQTREIQNRVRGVAGRAIEFIFGELPDTPEDRIICYNERKKKIIRDFRL